MNLGRITALVLTYNEAANIERVLERLSWCSRVVVVDSGSTDATLSILARYETVDVIERAFDRHADQWNAGLAQVATEWVLALDADHVLSNEFAAELEALDSTATAYTAPFVYCIDGTPIRGSLYPRRIVLFRTRPGAFVQDGHTQRVQPLGTVGDLRAPIFHDDRKPREHWLRNQRRYARLEAAKILATSPDRLRLTDRLRRAHIAPLLVPAYCLFGKLLVLDGMRGWRYTIDRTYAELLLSAALLRERKRLASPRIQPEVEGDVHTGHQRISR